MDERDNSFDDSNGNAKISKAVYSRISKTRLCLHYNRGSCERPGCRFAHSPAELRDRPDLTKTRMCGAYLQGNCQSEYGCKFAHGEHELRATPDLYKTTICPAWRGGRCVAGDKCRFAHGYEELRLRPNGGYPQSFPGSRDMPRLKRNSKGSLRVMDDDYLAYRQRGHRTSKDFHAKESREDDRNFAPRNIEHRMSFPSPKTQVIDFPKLETLSIISRSTHKQQRKHISQKNLADGYSQRNLACGNSNLQKQETFKKKISMSGSMALSGSEEETEMYANTSYPQRHSNPNIMTADRRNSPILDPEDSSGEWVFCLHQDFDNEFDAVNVKKVTEPFRIDATGTEKGVISSKSGFWKAERGECRGRSQTNRSKAVPPNLTNVPSLFNVSSPKTPKFPSNNTPEFSPRTMQSLSFEHPKLHSGNDSPLSVVSACSEEYDMGLYSQPSSFGSVSTSSGTFYSSEDTPNVVPRRASISFVKIPPACVFQQQPNTEYVGHVALWPAVTHHWPPYSPPCVYLEKIEEMLAVDPDIGSTLETVGRRMEYDD